MSAVDEAVMAEALALAALGRGRTSPNPMVGAVVVRGGEVVGRGFHPRAGDPHAEVFALREAGEAARGATIYVTLEPCCHEGRTGPCTDAVIAAGIARVVVGAVDPNPLVAGKGLARLRDAGLDVVSGVLGDQATRLNEAFNHWILRRQAFVTLKLASSLDGRIAARTGSSRWITGDAARARVHALRAANDAVMVGFRTAVADDPQLTARGVPGDWLPPLRVVLDPRLELPTSAHLFDPGLPGGVLVATAAPLSDPRATALIRRGVAVASFSSAADPRKVDLAALLELGLGRRMPVPVTSVLVEGGGELAASLLRDGLVHKIIMHQAPFFLGADGVPAVGALGFDAPADAPRLVVDSVSRLGDDVEIVAYPTPP